jgi:predicted DNA-binding transcriptional regulator AlpA
MMEEKRSLNEKEAAEYIGMSLSFLRQDRVNGFRETRTRGPEFSRIGRTVRYMKEELDAWLDKHKIKRSNTIGE